MKRSRAHALTCLAGAVWALLAGWPALADDTELFVASIGNSAGTRPNILLIIDTSLSMGPPPIGSYIVTQEPFDPSENYGGVCNSDYVFYLSGTGDPPSCYSDNWVDKDYMVCDAANQAFASTGYFIGTLAQYDSYDNGRFDTAEQWETLSTYFPRHEEYVECEADFGEHGGPDNTDVDVYPQSNDASEKWTDIEGNAINWSGSPTNSQYTLYSANYLNWYHYGETTTSLKIDIVKDVTTDLVSSVGGVNFGIMTLNYNSGGAVQYAISDVSDSGVVTDLTEAINDLELEGFTPLTETLYEAGQYFRGADVVYGMSNSVDASRELGDPDVYDSPIAESCQKNFIVFLTDGLPTEDVGANSAIPNLPDYGSVVGGGSCGSGDGACLPEMAEYLYKADLISDTIHEDRQFVTTYMIGFDYDDDPQILEDTAAAGGGEYFTANDTASLTTVLTNIVAEILDTSATFSAPAVSVNSFNRTQNLNDLYVALFEPSNSVHWPGNLKKYRLDPQTSLIVDSQGAAAVDPESGFFTDDSFSFWSAEPDGAVVSDGGAARRLPDPDDRNLYTFLAGADLTLGDNEVSPSNGLIDSDLLGIVPADTALRTKVLNFARGMDVNGDDSTAARQQMGDPLHGRPVIVLYGGTTQDPDVTDGIVYFVTNDGYLHAIDSETGVEQWAFVPPEFLPDLTDLYHDDLTADKHYGIDGSPVVQVEADLDGVIEDGEKVYLFFGMRRGGSSYYGLDVSDPGAPTVMWSIDSGELPGLGQSWSAPVPTRVQVADGSGQNEDKLVLIFAGGYDTTQDGASSYPDNVGNSLFMVDSETGDLLWSASDADADLNLPDMLYSFPGDVKVIDLDSDGYADRMYAADMGGQVWRFDIANGEDSADLVAGGLFAQLGAAPNETPTAEESRRFYYAPDVALVNAEEGAFLHVGVGSGHRAHPNSLSTHDRFYALRDYAPFTTLTQDQYDSLPVITEDDLELLTSDVDLEIEAGSKGWMLDLQASGNGWTGEKVLAEARTFDNQIFFTTFEPNLSGDSVGCEPKLGTNRLYILDILTGSPVTNLDESVNEEELTASDRFQEFNGSISSEVVFLFPSPDDEDCVGEDCTPPPVACVDLFCFPPGFLNNPVRTFWSQENQK